jgi:pullulanase/glycogen debranching enzyme
MPRTSRKIHSARWTSPTSGIVSLSRDWTKRELPPLFWDDSDMPLADLRMAPPLVFGDESGYFAHDSWITFCLRASRYPNFDLTHTGVYVAGPFNNWQPNFGRKAWRLDEAIIGGQEYYLVNVQKDLLKLHGKLPFKFVTGRGEWMEVPSGAPNVTVDEHGNHNLYVHPFRTGYHQFVFTTPASIDTVRGANTVRWTEDDYSEAAPMHPGEYLLRVDSSYEQGVRFGPGYTSFRLFAPRATIVRLGIFRKLDQSDCRYFEAMRVDVGTWETVIPEDCHGAYYYYYIDGEPDIFANFDPQRPVADPWALACVGPEGPSIALDPARIGRPARRFTPPCWHDLVIAEAHVRDLVAQAPIALDPAERLGFSGLAKWVRSPDFYLKKLGVNAVELQPVQQNDEPTKEGYHWGYMTNNYFAPNSSYALHPENGSQIDELRDLVAAFHERGMAVILDVVYNHVGEPNYLQYIDKHYYFDLTSDGKFTNWSGCGNTLDCNTPMTRKLVVKSLEWLIEAFDVDGFRFDLAELVGVEALKEVEASLKKKKPSVILIAEPWSFRGHIGLALRDTGFASWNDGYRECVRKYIMGLESIAGMKYFLSGSMEYLSSWPAQSVNYLESHDDMCWMDRITDNPGNNALYPTPTDRRRTHLMCAILMMSLGMPMLSSGQDFLRTKLGHNNTYKRGDLNALDYRRLCFFSATHEYFRSWIAFRLGKHGKLLRLSDRPARSYIAYYPSDNDSIAFGALYNADGSLGRERLFFAVNPEQRPRVMKLDGLQLTSFVQVADTETFVETGLPGAERLVVENGTVEIPPLSCALWMRER